jgi:hypothetical protein
MLTYLPFCTCLSVQSAHNVHIIAQSDENYVADAVSAIVKFKSVSNHECQSYRFFRGSDLRIEATQFNLSAEIFKNIHKDVHSFNESRYCDCGQTRGLLQSRGHGCDA